MRHFFSFNPKNKVTITLNEVLEFVFVTEFGTKNVIFVTIVTNQPYNLLIIKCIFRVEKSPWKVRVLLHRELLPDSNDILNQELNYLVFRIAAAVTTRS